MHMKDTYIGSYKTGNDKEENRVIKTRHNSLHTKQVKVKNKWVINQNQMEIVITPVLHFIYIDLAGYVTVMKH